MQKMEDEAECVESIFQSYVVQRSKVKIFLFFEGRDDFNYYYPRISPFIYNTEFRHYACSSKKKVLEVYSMIKKRTKSSSQEKLLFFIDRDFEKKGSYPNDIYVTPTYSIENFYITDNALSNILKGVLGLSEDSDEDENKDFKTALDYLKDKRQEIIDKMIYANAWYSLQINLCAEKKYPKLGAIKQYSVIKDIVDKSKLEDMVPNFISVSEQQITCEIKYLKEDPIGRIRGKYFEQTMPKYLMQLFQDANGKSNRKYFSKRRKSNINVNADNMVVILASYADVPRQLIQYIKDRLVMD